jgi:anti-sigma B factor antagonist
MNKRQWIVIAPQGDIDVPRADALAGRVDADCTGQCPNTVIDLTGVSFMDSSGLSWLCRIQEHLRSENAELRIVLSGGPVARLLDLTGLVPVFRIHGSIEEAVDSPLTPA